MTVNGKAQIVIQDAQAYQEKVDLLETIKEVNATAISYDKGEGRSATDAFEKLDKKIKDYGE